MFTEVSGTQGGSWNGSSVSKWGDDCNTADGPLLST